LSLDAVGYSRLMGVDEAGTLARLKTLRREVIDPAIATHSGRVVKLMGDGALVEFASAVDAVMCAVEIQRLLGERDAGEPEETQIRFRVGINVGDVIVDGDDIYGDGVNVAARIEQLAAPGEICLSGATAEQVRAKIPVELVFRGEQAVKNITRPIQIYCAQPTEHEAAGPYASAASATEKSVRSRPSIAVLAFENMSDEAEQEYFSDGISEDIITDLSRLSELHVIARNSSFVYKDRAISVLQVGQELGVSYVLEGSVRKAGNRVRVTAQLIDSTTSGHVWAERYDRDLTDIFAVQDELTHEIVSALKLKLTLEEKDKLSHKPKVNVEAYNWFLRGREQFWLHTKSGNIAARNLFAHALDVEPDYAAAHALVAFTHVTDYINGWSEDPERSLRVGLEVAVRATRMDETDPHVQVALAVACLWDRQLDRALASAKRAVLLAPSSAEGRMAMAHVQIYMGKPVAAIEAIKEYMRLDPQYRDLVLHFLGEAHFALDQY
jgi:adenylate cyclase